MRLKEDMIERLKRHAKAQGTTPEAVIEQALARELENVPPTRPAARRSTDVSLEVPAFAFSRRARHPLD